MLFGHIVSKNGIVTTLGKMNVILESPASTNGKELSRFLGQICWHSRMLHTSYWAIPLHTSMHLRKRKQHYKEMKVVLSLAPVVQPMDCSRESHVFVNASSTIIISILMQLYNQKWYKPVGYAKKRFLSMGTTMYSYTG